MASEAARASCIVSYNALQFEKNNVNNFILTILTDCMEDGFEPGSC